ncbi:hypothetical protein E4U19_001195 [Claviceps sp. Clav32 group G5]|nr:hypothetical protein E4U19_001195 [Claviceps sp. Clav32 group G5]
MKFSAVLGTFALSTLEAYRAYASPVEALEERAPEYCCMRFEELDVRHYEYVPYVGAGKMTPFKAEGACHVQVEQGTTPPSKGGCSDWKLYYSEGCPHTWETVGADRDSSCCRGKCTAGEIP